MPMGNPRTSARRPPREPSIRINHRIRVPSVRVVGVDGTMLGVMQTHEAIRYASEQGLDLIEVNPKADPPVCKILDFGKYKYDEKKREAEAKRKQTVVEIKELKLRPKTDKHDLETKARSARQFLVSGNKVKFTVRFRGREITHPEKAREQLDWLLAHLEDLSNIESPVGMEGRTMGLMLAPKATVMQKVTSARLSSEKEKHKASPSKDKEAPPSIDKPSIHAGSPQKSETEAG